MKKLVIGILAHVDAGKTTLSEAMLYTAGALKKPGRVDNGDAFLDTYELEKERGITIFSKQARLFTPGMQLTLVDTPGHVDFSAEAERTLRVLDYAILVISGPDGVQGHTKTLWRLLESYDVPVFLFVNKMDQGAADKGRLLEALWGLSDTCVDFTAEGEEFYDALAMCSEEAMDEFLESGSVADQTVAELIESRSVFPCFFGSALKQQGIAEFMEGLLRFTIEPSYPNVFGARVFKIGRDAQGSRLTYLKITGGSLKVKELLAGQKVNQIRLYSGARYETAGEVKAGEICAVTGLADTLPGECFGAEEPPGHAPLLVPVLMYRMILPSGCDAAVILPKLAQLEEEEPLLHILWEEELKEIQVQLMGEVQTEILKRLIADRFQVQVEFGEGNIVYKETIKDTVEGVGHFEPLRHYAEVHLLLEPGEPDSGMVFDTACSEDLLDGNWQRLILTHLNEKEHRGVLTGAALTDMRITLVSGRAHQKHTEGGDFREATYRAVRQGLMQAQSVLLEPYYDYTLEVPEQAVGRAMSDMEKFSGSVSSPVIQGGMAILSGRAPVALIQSYQREVTAYTKGEGRLSLSFGGYLPCHNADEVIERASYDPERDTENPADSVFCSHGAGIVVKWDEVKAHMHLLSILLESTGKGTEARQADTARAVEDFIDEEEIEQIFARTFFANKSDKTANRKKFAPVKKENISGYTGIKNDAGKLGKPRAEYLLVDGYNIIFSWDELRELARVNIDGARGRLLDIMCNYQGIRGGSVIVVFDAYRVQGHVTEVVDYHNIHVVYTKEAETADQYIEKFAHDNSHRYKVTVATSDGLEQIIIRGQGCLLLSARELFDEVVKLEREIEEKYLENGTGKEVQTVRIGEKLPKLLNLP